MKKAYTWIYIDEGVHIVKFDWSSLVVTPDLEFQITILPKQAHYLKITGSWVEGYDETTVTSEGISLA